MKRYILPVAVAAFLLTSCGGEEKKEEKKDETTTETPTTNDNSEVAKEAQAFLDSYTSEYQSLMAVANEAEWTLNTRIVDGDTISDKLAQEANGALASFTGSKANTEQATKYLESKDQLSPVQIKQLAAILYAAGGNPEVVSDIVAAKIKASTDQTKLLFGFKYKLNGKPVSTNQIDEIMNTSNNLDDRLAAWEASKEVGVGLKGGLENLRNLRNQSVQALGYDDYFNYQVSDYGMNTQELRDVCQDMIKEVWPLYRELHTWARYTLAEKYGQEVPEMLPAHWLPNRWGQDWVGLVNVEGLDIDKALKEKPAEWITKEGERFYMSLGFDALPQSFWDKSSLFPAPVDADWSKNNHASAWHMNNAEDVRSLMSVESNTDWWGTALHELGHIYYYIEYSNPDVPIILRGGANRAYHEAMGSLMGLAALQPPFLAGRGLLPEGVEVDETQTLLKESLDFIVLIPWGAGVMTEFEHELYANNLPIDQFNAKWWEMKKKYQGIVPPTDRGEEYCDAASKTHINNDPAQYYDYAMSNILLFQFHDYIAKNILKEDPHATNYWGNKEVGAFLKKLMYPGATVDWREHLKESIGSEMSAKAMMDYFAPLMDYLKQQNEGRTHTLAESI